MKTLLETAIETGPLINQNIDTDEKNRRISKTTLQVLKEAGFLKLFLPKSLGGIEADPFTTANVVEEVSRHNTAAGWSIMVANISSWWCARLTEKGINEIFASGADTFIAGAFHPPMKATPVEGGYTINGRSPLTSNIHEAQWIFVTAFVMEQDKIKMNNGIPEVIGVFMNSKDCEIIDTWYTVGMKATDSNDVGASNVFVPGHRAITVVPEFEPNAHFKSPLYKFPAIGAGIACLIAPVALAVARNAVEELKILAEKKVPFGSMVSIRERGTVQKKLGMAEAFVQSSRAFLYQTITALWNKTLAGERVTLEERAGLLLAVTHTNQTCAQAVDMMYSSSGTTGIYTSNKLAHYFTDAQVIRQHGFSNESRYETAAQIYFGLHPDLPVILF